MCPLKSGGFAQETSHGSGVLCVTGDEVLVEACESQGTSYALGGCRGKPIVYELHFIGHCTNSVASNNIATKFNFGLGKTAFGSLGVELFFV